MNESVGHCPCAGWSTIEGFMLINANVIGQMAGIHVNSNNNSIGAVG